MPPIVIISPRRYMAVERARRSLLTHVPDVVFREYTDRYEGTIAKVLPNERPVLALIWNGEWGAHKTQREWCERHQVPVLIFENALWNRDTCIGIFDARLNQIPEKVDEWHEACYRIRPEFKVKPRPKLGNRVLILGQVPGDTQHGMTEGELYAWLHQAKQSFTETWGRFLKPVFTWRPHPRHQRWSQEIQKNFGFDLGQDSIHGNLELDIDEHDIALTFNSTSGIEVLRRKVPLISSDRAVYSDVTSRPDSNKLGWDEPLVTKTLEHLGKSCWSSEDFMYGSWLILCPTTVQSTIADDLETFTKAIRPWWKPEQGAI